jgi:hydroxymethylpyrimidine/phosphomethylpyrimidine kinase
MPAERSPARVAVALTIAGSDSSGGAGIQADLKTFAAFGVYGASAITALTAQNTTGVQAVHPVPPDFVARQIASVLDDLDVGAVKTGMLANAAIIGSVVGALSARSGMPVVVDPVMVATSGDVLLEATAIAAMREQLFPRAHLITPNLPEAAKLLDEPLARTEREVEGQLARLGRLGARAVLLKGGHGEGPEAVDFLLADEEVRRLASPRIETRNTHGTGCTLSAAITALLAEGVGLVEAVARGKAYVHRALTAARGRRLGAGSGPVDHEFAVRAQPKPA